MDLAWLWFSFRGRINRGKYWLVVLVNSLILAAIFLIALASQSWSVAILAGLIFIPFLVSSIAIAVRRLHDRDKSAWWLLLFYLLPSVLEGMVQSIEDTAAGVGLVSSLPALALSVLAFVLSVWGFVELGCLGGTVGDNRYGPDPLEGRG